MRKFLCGLSLALVTMQGIYAQATIVASEYFIGTDPGPGNATAAPQTWDGSLATLLTSAEGPGSPGFYRLSVRYKSSNGLWSETRSVMFYVGGEATGSGGTPTVEQVVAAEYFIGTDLGPGSATPAPQIWDGNLATLVTTATGPDSPGFYRLSVRYKSSNGLWSETRSVMFYVGGVGNGSSGTPTIEQVVAAEYFIGTDPGPGSATAAPQIWDGNLATLVTTVAGPDSPGFYRLSVRYKSSNGLWSETRSVMFYVGASGNGNGGEPEVVQVAAAEYFFDSDPGVGNGISIPLDAAAEVDVDALVAVNNLALGNHEFFLRFQSSTGLWSMAEMRPFEVCTFSGPIASFNFIQNGSEVFLESTSINQDSLSWAMGNSIFSHAPFPTYTNSPGVYPVTLTAFNVCGEHSVTQDVSLYGISSFSPTVGCNLGSTTITIQGAGFQPGDDLYWLQHSDGSIISPDTVLISEDGLHAMAKFNLVGTSLGHYSLNVEIPNFEVYTALDSFMITDVIGAGISYTFHVPTATRANQWRDYSLVISNNSNLDIEQIPFLIAFPDYADVELKFENLDGGIPNYESYVQDEMLPDFVTLDSLNGQPFNKKIYLGLCPYIPGNTQVIYTVRAKMNLLGSHKPFVHVYAIQDSTLLPVNSAIDPNLDNRNGELTWQCFNLNADCAVGLLQLTNTVAGLIPGLSDGLTCLNGAINFVLSNVSGPSPANLTQWKALNDNVSYYSMAINCGMAALSFGPFGAAFTAIRASSIIKEAAQAINTIGGGISLVNDLEAGIAPCWIAKPKKNPADTPTIQVLASYDPNEISGIDEFNGFTNEPTFTYTISCENEANADLPAVEVNLYDTLNLNFFNPSTFRLNSITLPDTTIIFPNGTSEFATEYTLDNGLLLRISAKLNLSNGVAHWRFISLDPTTLDYPLDLSLGLLPPNVNSPEGEAFVTFSIDRWSNTTDGDQVNNFASIIFDTNSPIITNIWENELDLIAPVTVVNPLAVVTDSIIHLEWTGTDNSSGISYYTIYASENGGPFIELNSLFSLDSINFVGQYGVEYAFYIEAVDHVGNREVKSTIAEVIAIPWPDQLLVQPIITGPSCAGADNASIVLSTFGGQGNYTYTWSNGGTQSWLDNLAPGIYSVTISDVAGQSISQSFTIEEPVILIVQPEVVQPHCWFDNGSATLQITGGLEPYTIEWNGIDPQTLAPGVYPITVTDANGCSTEREIIVQSEAPVAITYSIQTTDVLCAGDNSGSAFLEVLTGNGQVTADWQVANPTQLSAGAFEVVLTDSEDCSVTAVITIEEPQPITVSTQTIDSDSETACNGSIELSISGGTAPYAVVWPIPQGATGTSVSNLCEGTYAATITDNNGCEYALESIEIATAVSELTGLNQITIMPNPSQGKYTLSVQCAQGGVLNWVVYDEQGRSVGRSYNQWCGLGTHHWPIDLQNEPNGSYLLQLQFEHGKTTRQLLKVGM